MVVALVGTGGKVTKPPPQGQPAAGISERAQPGEERPSHPKGNIRNCLRCHVRPGPPPPEKISFCTRCHSLAASHSSAPTPAHPVRFEAPVWECWLCHSPHRGPEATDHATSETGTGAGLCAACHLPLNGLASEEVVRDSCAQCHNLGLPPPPRHPPLEEAKSEGCTRCHEEVMR